MAETTGISWCDSTFNPWIGCTKVSPGCDNCYAVSSMPARTLGIQWGPGMFRHRTTAANWRAPVRWQADAAAFQARRGRRRRVFCASLADVFDNAVPDAWRADLFALIEATPDLDWLLLTKRIGNVPAMLRQPGMPKAGLPAHVWLGASVVNHDEYSRDVHKLLAVDASVRFLSVEPMLGPISATPTTLGRLDWVICGGESGAAARPIAPGWVASLRAQCQAAGVPFFFKQWGGVVSTAGGCDLDGQEVKQWPQPRRMSA